MIESFDKLEGLSRINIIAGKGGVGKTQLLESIQDKNYGMTLLFHTSWIFGSRINRFIHCLDGAYSIMVIDEIENGIHYSEYENVWQQIYELAIEHDIQVFATTHSLEMIHAAHEVIEDDLMYYRLGRVESGAIESFRYNSKVLASAVELNFEVRG